MIESLLIANRGEIARRIIRTARRMGVRTMAVFSEADAGSPHVLEADDAVEIGAASPAQSYLKIDRVLAAAMRTGAQAIHPGYGFLSENAQFAQAVEDAGLVWVGPPAAAIQAMGLKDAAKRVMAAAGVPTTPGYLGEDQSTETLKREAAIIGWPVLIKAVAGGGGKGMRAVHRPEEFEDALAAARREAAAAFGDDRILLETLIASPRHIEVQVFCDRHGGAVHLFERDCSIQRRHQKVIEEAPAPGMSEAMRAEVCASALQAAKAVGYVGAGTVEFIADASDGLRADRIWFMEMNTRLQVEHPVTEAVTGVDLVEWQLRVAAGEPLPLSQDRIRLDGHAIEARLCAEDPEQEFLPSMGPLRRLRLPDDVRVESGVEEGGVVSPHYDPMIAKLIAWAPAREDAAARLSQAVASVQVWPVRTNAAFLVRCLDHPDYLEACVDTGFIERRRAVLCAPPEPRIGPAVAPELLRRANSMAQRNTGAWDPVQGVTGLRLNGPSRDKAWVHVDGVPIEIGIDPAAPLGEKDAILAGEDAIVFCKGRYFRVGLSRPPEAGDDDPLGGGSVIAPMPGRIVAISVSPGDDVRPGQTLAVLEAMKMEHGLVSPASGRVTDVLAAVGETVTEGAVVVRLEPAPKDPA